MKAAAVRDTGTKIARQVACSEIIKAFAELELVLYRRIPFDILRVNGYPIGGEDPELIHPFLHCIAAAKNRGGWVVVAADLQEQLSSNLAGCLSRSHGYIEDGGTWYWGDILGEGVVGNALARHFIETLPLLEPWRHDHNHWVRRDVGSSIHFWAKQSCGKLQEQAADLLNFIEPVFEEPKMESVRDIGWGLKTLGNYYPAVVYDWLFVKVIQKQRPHRKMMLRKGSASPLKTYKKYMRTFEKISG